MAEEPKKISFGFTKINKKPVLSLPKKEEKDIQFIACLEENSIKLLNGEEKEKELPIIPLRNGNILRDNMIEALKARKDKIKTTTDSTDVKTDNSKDGEEAKPLTLDELAAKEILEDLKKVNENEEVQEILTIPQVEAVKVSEKESTLEDYDSMPVNQFGLAVLRGMGWKPDKGIGKNAKIVEPINPVLRPKGMGLGADKVIQTIKNESKEELVMKKGAFVKVISGQYKDLYGKVEGFNDLPGRIIVRLTLQNDVVSISENLVVLVTSGEYNKNSKILNLKEYNQFNDNKPLPATSELKVKAPARDFRKDDISEDNRNSKQEHKSYDSSRNRGKIKSDEISDARHEKYKYGHGKYSSSESDSDRRTKHNSDKYKAKRSSKYDKVRVDSESSDSASSDERKKSKSKKHRKHSKRRSRSRSRTHKKKKKRNYRSRS